MSTSKKKNLGQGMKPRGNQVETEKAEEPVSADEGQEETSVEAVSEAQEVEQTPNNLESVFEAGAEGTSVAAKDEGLDLQKMLEESGGIVIGLSQGFTPESTVGEVFGGPIKVRAPEMQRLPEEKSDAQKQAEQILVQNLDTFPTAEDLAKFPLYRFDPNTGTKEAVVERVEAFPTGGSEKFPPQRLERLKEVMAEIEAMGQQPDGTFRLPIDIAEGSIEPIRQEAGSNGMTAEQWCSQQFNFFLESWWAKPKGR